jgi:hypothetical protein
VKPAASINDVSAQEWADAVHALNDGGYVSHSRLTVESQGAVLTDTFYNSGEHLALIGGTVSFDRLAESRSSGRITVEVTTNYGMELVSPLFQYDIVPYVGIETATKLIWVPMGKFNVVSRRVQTGDGLRSVEMTLVDWSSRLRENPWSTAFALTGTPTYTAAIQQVLTNRWPAAMGEAVLVGDLGDTTVPPFVTYSPDQDPWNAIWRLAQSVGGEVYFDRYSQLRCRLIPSFTANAPVLELLSSDYNVLDGSISSTLDRNDVYNGVICRGSAPWLLFPVSATVWDENPMSLTWRGGLFGERPKTITDATVGTDAQCLTVAQAEFTRIAGIQEKLELKIITDPMIEVGDVIRVMDNVDLAGLYMIDRMQVSLVGMKTTLSVRKRIG